MKRISFFKNQKGQTAVEYLLLVVVALSIGIAFKKRMTDFILKNPNSMISKSLNNIQSSFDQDSSGRYSWFSMRM